VTGLDWVIVGVVTLLALFGFGQGFIAGALSLAGFALGAYVGTRIGPLLLEEGAESPQAPLFGLLGALLGGAVLAAGFEGVGAAVRARLIPPRLAVLDGLLGALLIAALGVAIAWLLGAVALTNGTRDMRREVQRSAILSHLNEALPPSGPLLNALARFDPFPQVDGPDPGVGAPQRRILRDPDVRAAQASIVRVRGTACGLGVEGSGWVAGGDLVVTNAHVVAGQDDTRVLVRGEPPGIDATLVHFDERNDLALLRTPPLDAPALGLAGDPQPGTAGAILGFPLNGPFDARPARIGSTAQVVSADAYGRGPIRRRITSLRGLVRSGNSGGPVIDGQGQVSTTIFAARTTEERAGYGVPNDVVREALSQPGRSEVSSGPCAR
jgi:S1-C subfamily serine protease